jgi:hypothetical protein
MYLLDWNHRSRTRVRNFDEALLVGGYDLTGMGRDGDDRSFRRQELAGTHCR